VAGDKGRCAWARGPSRRHDMRALRHDTRPAEERTPAVEMVGLPPGAAAHGGVLRAPHLHPLHAEWAAYPAHLLSQGKQPCAIDSTARAAVRVLAPRLFAHTELLRARGGLNAREVVWEGMQPTTHAGPVPAGQTLGRNKRPICLDIHKPSPRHTAPGGRKRLGWVGELQSSPLVVT
jgi:hypothetical protein